MMGNEHNNPAPAGAPAALRRTPPGVAPTAAPIAAAAPQAQPGAGQPMPASDLAFEIMGDNSKFVEIKLKPGQAIVGEITALMYFESGVTMKMRMSSAIAEKNAGMGLIGKLLGMGKAVLLGQKLFLMTFSNTSNKEQKVAFSMPYPGSIVSVNLGSLGGELFCQNNSFLCASNDLKISAATSRDLGANFLNTINNLQKIEGKGTLFMFCGGSLLQRKLIPGDSFNVTTGTALAMQPSIVFRNKFIRNVGLTGQGHALTEISGSGHVWLQSLPFNRTKENVIEQVGTYFGIKKKKAGGLPWAPPPKPAQ
jgi:uncharacterized protein (AIM24 family)